MVKETVHIVQPYWEDKRKGLVPAEALPVRSADAAHERAKRLFNTGNYAGVDAFTITADEELGEYGEPVFSRAARASAGPRGRIDEGDCHPHPGRRVQHLDDELSERVVGPNLRWPVLEPGLRLGLATMDEVAEGEILAAPFIQAGDCLQKQSDNGL